MFNKLMNNPYVGFAFGLIATLLCGLISFATGETLNVPFFCGIFGVIMVLAKEVVNTVMLFNPFNKWVSIAGVIGAVLGTGFLFLV